MRLDHAAHRQVVSVLKPVAGFSACLELSKLTVESLETEEFLIFATRTDAGQRHTLDSLCAFRWRLA